MKNLDRFAKRVRMTAFAFIVSMPVVTGLRAGEIHDAAAAGDLNKVRALLEADPTLLESKDERLSYRGNTPLISACWGPPSHHPAGGSRQLPHRQGRQYQRTQHERRFTLVLCP